MDIRVLRYFLAVAREESISRAADVLHITQPTLSRQMMLLED
ncbi:MAG: LysR family transcriptional regulator, partial [Anaerovibrio sp.]